MNNAQILLPAQLAKLESEKLLRLESPAPKWEYVFRSVIAQEVVYEGLLMTQRRHLHGVVADTLEILAPTEIEQLAFHYSHSDNWDKALYYLKRASQKARREYANHVAIGYYTDILTCLTNKALARGETYISAEYWDTVLERAKLYNLIGQRDEELEDLGTLGLMGEALNDERRRALGAKQWAYLYETSGDYESGLELIERALHLAKQAGDEKLAGEAYNHWGKLLYLSGKYEAAIDCLQKAWDIAQKHEDKTAQADCLTNQGIVAHYQADYNLGLSCHQQAADLKRDHNDQSGLAYSLCHLGQVHYDMGQYMTAKRAYEQSLTLHRAIGDRAGEALSQHHLGKIERSLGNYVQARTHLGEALLFYESIGDRHQEAYSLYHLGFVHTRLGEYKTSLAYLEEALDLLTELNAPWWTRTEALIYYSWTLLEDGQVDKAQDQLTEAMEIERDTPRKVSLIEDTALLGRVALTQEDLGTAGIYAQHMQYFLKHYQTQGIEHPAMVYLTCYHILQATDQCEPAQTILAQGQQYLRAQADLIEDPLLRERYLSEIPENQALRALANGRF